MKGEDRIWRHHRHGAETTPRRLWPTWLRLIGAALSLVIALGLLTLSALLHRGAPVVSAFYTPPSPIPSTPGVLLRSEPFAQSVPSGARVWRILYTVRTVEWIEREVTSAPLR